MHPRWYHALTVKYKLLADQASGRSYALAFDMGDDALQQLGRFLGQQNIIGARLYGVGGFGRATLAYYDMDQKRYVPIEVDEQVEVLSCIGNVAMYQDNPRIHAHCVLGHRDGHTTGGHLLFGVVRPTLELMLMEIATGMHRTDRPDIGIPLLDFG